MSLRGRPVEQTASLPDGREVQVRVGVPDDSYIPRRELGIVVTYVPALSLWLPRMLGL